MKTTKLFMVLLLTLLMGTVLSFSHANAAIAPLDRPTGAADNAVSAERGVEIARTYLQSHATELGLNASDLADLRVGKNTVLKSSGARVVHFTQSVNGIAVHNGFLNVTITTEGEVIFVGNRGVANLQKSFNTITPTISPEAAIASAAAAFGLDYSPDSLTLLESLGGVERERHFSGGDLSIEYIPVKLAYQPMANGALLLAWDLNLYQMDAQHWWHVRVDATSGEVLSTHDWVVSENFDKLMEEGAVEVNTAVPQTGSGTQSTFTAPSGGDGSSYLVYDIPVESPNHTSPVPPADARTTINEPAESTASPFGWHDTNGAAGAEFQTTQGNNVHAYTDVDANNTPDAGSSPSGGAGLDFAPPLNLTQPPSAYRPAAVVNLFVWNNFLHDVPYLYGFDEAAGNFQENNYGRGGLGSDYVQAEAQDGSGTNNANFATPADGQNPRMQMYIGTNVTPNVDGDLDNGVIAHEYGHGISNRLTGNSVSCLQNAEQMGEGWSDWQALMFTMKPGDQGDDARGIGTYLFGQPATGPGIRPAPYSTDFAVNNFDYNDRNSVAIPHGIGFLWATMLWEMNWNLIDRYGYNPDIYDYTALDDGNILAYQLVQDGMAIQPCSPGFEDGRDAILAADQALTGGDNRCDIWEAFAVRGMGFSADQGSSSSVSDGTAAFDMPPFCLGTAVTPSSQAICAGTNAVYNVAVTAPFTQTTSLSGSGNPAPSTMSFVPVSGTPAFSSTLTVANTAGVAAGNYTLEITGTSASYVNNADASLQVFAGTPSAATLTAPANGASNVSTAPTFQWSAVTNITGYQFQVATDAAFNSIVISETVTTNTYTPATTLNPQTTYYWRVRGLNPCGNGVYSSVFNFTTANLICFNPNVAIPDNSTAGVSYNFTVAASQVITDLNVYVNLTHTYIGDVDLQLTHGATSVRFFDRPGVPTTTFGCSGDNLNNTFDDEATIVAENGCANGNPSYPIGASLVPNNPLSAFDGANSSGSWTLLARDLASADTGTLNTICLQLPASAGGGSPEINVTPTELDETHSAPPQVSTDTLTIQNTGNADLTWTITEDDSRPFANPNPAQPRDPNAPVARQGTANGDVVSPLVLGPIVGDGSFETGSPNAEWEEFSSNFGTPLCDAACGAGGGTGPRTGAWWSWFGGTTSAETGIITQTVTIPSGGAELTFWLEIPATATGTNGFLSVRMDGTEVFRAEETTTGYGTYAEVSVDVSAYADGDAHDLVFFSQTDAGSAVTNFFVDDVAITTGGGPVACDAPSDIPWLTLSSTAGTTGGGASTNVAVTYNSASLATGTYTGTLCIASNDADEPLVQVPVSLEVGTPTAVTLGDLTTSTNTVPMALFATTGLILLVAAGFILRRK